LHANGVFVFKEAWNAGLLQDSAGDKGFEKVTVGADGYEDVFIGLGWFFVFNEREAQESGA
jgi:hypothetical protein